MELGRHTKEQKYLYVAHKSVTDINIELMSKALVLVASLYMFLVVICDKQERETSMKGINKQGQGKRHHKQIELLAIAYVLLSSCFFFIHYFSFFSQPFFLLLYF